MSAARPQVSVVMPVYRAADRVSDAIAGVLGLDVVDMELIVVDDASPDGTYDAALAACGNDPRCTVVRRSDNGGSTLARRTGIDRSTGEYVWQVDVDDRWSPRILCRLLDAARAAEADVVVCRARRVERNGRSSLMEGVGSPVVCERDDAVRLVLDGTVRGYLWNKLFRRALLRTPPRSVLSSQDDQLVVLAALSQTNRLALLPDVLYEYHDTPGSISDSSLLELDNVAETWSATIDWATEVAGELAPDLVAYFTAWYLLIPVLTTPSHQGWPKERADDVHRRFAPQLTWPVVAATLRHDRRRGVHALALKLLGPRFGPLYRTAGRLAGFSIR